jgi:hypothetical protein
MRETDMSKPWFPVALVGLVLALTAIPLAAGDQPVQAIDIGSHRELFVDSSLIDRLDGVRLELQQPRPGGMAIAYDRPWEGVFAFYTTVFKDGDKYRMYYRGEPASGQHTTICYAESADGIRWSKPNLGLVEIAGSKDNNVLIPAAGMLAPFLDTRPGVSAEQRYKGNMEDKAGLLGYVSADGLHWKKLGEQPLVPRKLKNNFDSQNVMFWSEAEQQYVLYARHSEGGRRAQARATSKDFLDWSPQVLMTYSDTGSTVPSDHLYTSQVQPYFRAPHIYISLPGRFMHQRRVLNDAQAKELDVQPGGGGVNDIADGVLQTSRASTTLFDRTFLEALVRPGMGLGNWVSRTNYPACGIVQTGPAEMSIYVQRHYGQKTAHLERLTLRLDGFASAHAPYKGGELVTRPLRFTGKELEINYATSAAGSLRVEIQDAAGKPIPGFTLADCPEIIGDTIVHVVNWKNGADVTKLAGHAIRLRLVMKDADLFALRFR